MTDDDLDVLAEVFEDFIRPLTNGPENIPPTKLIVIMKAIDLRDRLLPANPSRVTRS